VQQDTIFTGHHETIFFSVMLTNKRYSQVVGNICDLRERGSAGHGRQRESSRSQHIPTLRETNSTKY